MTKITSSNLKNVFAIDASGFRPEPEWKGHVYSIRAELKNVRIPGKWYVLSDWQTPIGKNNVAIEMTTQKLVTMLNRIARLSNPKKMTIEFHYDIRLGYEALKSAKKSIKIDGV